VLLLLGWSCGAALVGYSRHDALVRVVPRRGLEPPHP
jgi:hypothetical protein